MGKLRKAGVTNGEENGHVVNTTHKPMGQTWGTKIEVAFANIFMAEVETDILNQSALKPLVGKRYVDDIVSIQVLNREEITQFIEQANKHYPTIKLING